MDGGRGEHSLEDTVSAFYLTARQDYSETCWDYCTNDVAAKIFADVTSPGCEPGLFFTDSFLMNRTKSSRSEESAARH